MPVVKSPERLALRGDVCDRALYKFCSRHEQSLDRARCCVATAQPCLGRAHASIRGKNLVLFVVFITSVCLFGLGIVLPLVHNRRRRTVDDTEDSFDDRLLTVDVVIAAYLEASVINETVRRLKDQLASSCVPGRVIVVASDAETYSAACDADLTFEVARDGKPAAVNAGVAASSADIVVLTDANCSIEPNDWPLLVRSGLMSARLLTGSKRERGSRERLFWLYEGLLKSRRGGEQKLPATLAVIGEFLAFRREDYTPIPDRKSVV